MNYNITSFSICDIYCAPLQKVLIKKLHCRQKIILGGRILGKEYKYCHIIFFGIPKDSLPAYISFLQAHILRNNVQHLQEKERCYDRTRHFNPLRKIDNKCAMLNIF